MATVPRLQRYYQGATTSCPRMSFGLLFSPSGSAGACRGSCPPMGRSRRRTGPATDRGLDFHAGNPLSSLFAHGQEQDLPGSLATHPVTLRRSTTPDDPLRLAISGASGAAPTRLTMKASSFTDFEAARRFVTCCLRFTTGVTARHARLASGWRAAPLPGGSRTRWIATRGFRSSHQGFPWRKPSRRGAAMPPPTRPTIARADVVGPRFLPVSVPAHSLSQNVITRKRQTVADGLIMGVMRGGEPAVRTTASVAG